MDTRSPRGKPAEIGYQHGRLLAAEIYSLDYLYRGERRIFK
jgi:hypothetical protein